MSASVCRSNPGLALAAAAGLFSSIASPVEAAEAHLEPRPMALRDCVTEALGRNFDIQIDRLNPLIASHTLRATYGDYDPSLSFSGQHNFSSDAGGIDDQNRPYLGSSSESDSVSGTINGVLPTGMSYTLAANASDTYGDRGGGIALPFDSSRSQWTSFNLRQPILRNFWIDSTRVNIRTRRNDLASSRYGVLQTVISTVTQVEQAYFDLVATLENVRNQQKALELAERLYSENRRRVEIGIMAPLDEKEAQSQMATSRATLISAESAVALAQNALKRLITDRLETENTPDIRPTEPLDVAPVDLDVQLSRELGLQLRPDLQQLALALDSRQQIVRYQRNQLYPQLDLFGNLGYSGAGAEFSDSLSQIADASAPFHAFGAVITFPLVNRRARENYAISKEQREQAELQMRRLRQEIVVQISDALQSAQSSFERVGATREARQFAEAALAAEEKKLQSGKSTSFIVLQLQQRLNVARFDELRTQADYDKSLSLLRQREGTTLRYHHIDFPDAPTPENKRVVPTPAK